MWTTNTVLYKSDSKPVKEYLVGSGDLGLTRVLRSAVTRKSNVYWPVYLHHKWDVVPAGTSVDARYNCSLAGPRGGAPHWTPFELFLLTFNSRSESSIKRDSQSAGRILQICPVRSLDAVLV